MRADYKLGKFVVGTTAETARAGKVRRVPAPDQNDRPLTDPRVTVDAEIGAMAAGFAHHHEAPLTVLKGDVRTALDGWSLHHDPTAMNIGAALTGQMVVGAF